MMPHQQRRFDGQNRTGRHKSAYRDSEEMVAEQALQLTARIARTAASSSV